MPYNRAKQYHELTGGVITTVHDTEVREGYKKKVAFVLPVKDE